MPTKIGGKKSKAMNRYRARIRRVHLLYQPLLGNFAWAIDYKGEEYRSGVTMTYTGAVVAATWRIWWYRFIDWVW